jgi:flavin-dependent dehydrogenase
MKQTSEGSDRSDVAIIGGGPGGATAAYYLARQGLRVTIIERERFPRYAVGESLLPRNLEVFRDMGFEEVLEREDFMRKDGAVFADSGDGSWARIGFAEGLTPEYDHAYQVPRDRFDLLLQQHALGAGAQLVQGTARELIVEDERVVGVVLDDGESREIRARFVIDASGRRAFIGTKLGMMQPDARLDTASVFGLFDGVQMPEVAEPGDIAILAYDAGWFWMIPFADGRISLGTVVDRSVFDDLPDRAPEALFAALVDRAGGRVQELMRGATRTEDLHVLRRYNRRATRFAGAGWALVGDAAMFVDPVFSAGVLVATTEGKMVAEIAGPLLLDGRAVEAEHFDDYTRKVLAGYAMLERYIYGWKDPVFRKFFLNPPASGKTRQAVIAVLAGNLFDPDLIGRADARLFRMVYLYRLWLRLTAPWRRWFGGSSEPSTSPQC